jgi:hypothetical protein
MASVAPGLAKSEAVARKMVSKPLEQT